MDQISIDGSDMQNLGEFGRMPEDVYHKQVKIHVSKVNITSNCMLAILKILTGYFSRSSAMIADGVHSFADVFGSVLIIIGAMISSKAAVANKIMSAWSASSRSCSA